MTSLEGLVILVVEDEAIIAMSLEDGLSDAGARPVVAATLDQADAVLAAGTALDGAVLDVNIHGRRSFDLARSLAERGIPFVFATGYGDAELPDDLAHIPAHTKPYNVDLIRQALGRGE